MWRETTAGRALALRSEKLTDERELLPVERHVERTNGLGAKFRGARPQAGKVELDGTFPVFSGTITVSEPDIDAVLAWEEWGVRKMQAK